MVAIYTLKDQLIRIFQLQSELKCQVNPIRKVILNVLHTFFIDFNNQNIYVYVSEFKGRVKIDYESIQVALYHLIENATKWNELLNVCDYFYNNPKPKRFSKSLVFLSMASAGNR